MLGYPFKATWGSQPMSKGVQGSVATGSIQMTESGTHFMAPFHAAPFIPPYQMFQGYGDQNSTTLSPLDSNMVPAHGGLFGPLFGTLGPGSCPPAASVGPLFDPPSRGGWTPTKYPGAAGFPGVPVAIFPDPMEGRCMPHQDDPYRN